MYLFASSVGKPNMQASDYYSYSGAENGICAQVQKQTRQIQGAQPPLPTALQGLTPVSQGSKSHNGAVDSSRMGMMKWEGTEVPETTAEGHGWWAWW